ncbi:putative late blight resistance protein homolog R1B-16 isoform X1 [Salvia splendens]|uniref:putative late blight resistance protein homolog R1B-16 isoform X1 n=1 Tax=Salvia splendens TaxID=180675 RepID=UPI001C273487|nr:putative late blight resistance protein homolog R1B-16 isoform X1 [Salvia splendens]XP_042052901.1 putative late blight resistance protein homolog R1B-16 isoform X2 [Salvia splendens]XP_042052902.1 putative late blight resistance protein homolog R1B-16 isoform X1 [Salvia splendens]
MAAYAALVSLLRLIDDIQHHHSPPISLHKHQIQSLTENALSLQKFLKDYKSPVSDSGEADPLEMRIADAAYAAEEAIESHIVDKIRLSRSQGPKDLGNVSSYDDDNEQIKLIQAVQIVIEEMDRIKIVATETNTGKKVVVPRDQPPRGAVPSSSGKKSSGMMVFSDHVMRGIMDKLMSNESGRQVIPITGMGGIGKTALAQTVYSQKAIEEHFKICAWATISEQYNTREILCELVHQATKKDKEQLSERSEAELGLELHKSLFGRRFLIVMDDMWNIESWNEIEHCFPNNGNSSRIMVTTRLSQLSSQLNNHYSHQMEFLDESISWVLFSKTVFGEEQFPLELEKVGKEIAYNCRGLPLSIVVVGGILKHMERTQDCWESIRNNLASVVNLDNDKHCFRLLKMSYDHLPVYLKPCFLYLGVFEEDDAIIVSTLVKLWVSEGILKPADGKSLETTGKGFLKDLVDRNLVLVDELGSTGNIKRVKVHDLLRDLCLDQGKKEGFFHVIGESSPRGIDTQRRVVIRRNTSKEKVIDDLQYMSHARSIICEHGEVPPCRNIGLLRTLQAYKFRSMKDKRHKNPLVSGYVNLRHAAVEVASTSSIFSSFNRLWNLQTLIVNCEHSSTAPTQIWKMAQLRHIKIYGHLLLPDPPSDAVVMENLVELRGVLNFKCNEEVVKRIPNIRKLKLTYSGSGGAGHDDYYCLSNIKCLSKLESIRVFTLSDFRGNGSLYKLSFPKTLKSLNLMMPRDFEWEMMLETIGSLPLLEKIELTLGCFGTGKWEIFEGQFPCLKHLEFSLCDSLKHWTTEASSILPSLEKLRLVNLRGLENIPMEIGHILTLQNIHLIYCCGSVVKCAKEIVEEQMDYQGDDLPFHVHVKLSALLKYPAQMAGPNFEVEQ